MYYVYVLYSEKDHGIYIGYTTSLELRFRQHQNGEARSTAHRRPLILAYYEAYACCADAQSRERFLKSGAGRMYLKKQMRVFFAAHPLRIST